MLKKLLASFLLSSFLLVTLLVPVARAQGAWYNQSFEEFYSKVYDQDNPSEIFGERYTAAQVQWVIYGLLSFLVNTTGEAGQRALTCLMTKQITECADAIKEAIDQFTSSGPTGFNQKSNRSALAAVFTTRPISAVTYFKDVAWKLNLIPEAKAQGFGFEAASPILTLWRVSRNIAYALLTVVLIVIAFMIMFRVKISPQVVISVQSALPKIVITLILITFSYAIAGLLIDLMYVVMGLLSGFIVNSAISNFDWGQMFAAITGRSAFSLTMSYFFFFLLGWFAAWWNAVPILGLVPGVLIGIIVLLVALVVLLIAALRIFWLLIKTYVMILLQIILAPFQILLGAVTPLGFGTWLQGILANLAVYPVVAFMFILAFVFLSGAFGTPIWDPLNLSDKLLPFDIPLGLFGKTTWDPPLTAGIGAGGFLWLGASFVIIVLIPSAANMIKAVVQGKPFAYGTAIGEAVGRPTTLAGLGYGQYAAGQFKEAGIPRPLGYIPGIKRLEAEQRRRIGEVLDTLIRALRGR